MHYLQPFSPFIFLLQQIIHQSHRLTQHQRRHRRETSKCKKYYKIDQFIQFRNIPIKKCQVQSQALKQQKKFWIEINQSFRFSAKF